MTGQREICPQEIIFGTNHEQDKDTQQKSIKHFNLYFHTSLVFWTD